MMSALDGRTVIVTRPESQAGPLVRSLRKAGAEVIEIPAFKIATLPCPEFTAALGEIADAPGAIVVLTSANTVAHLAAALDAAGLAPDVLSNATIASVGPATEEAIKELDLEAAITASPHTGEALAEAIVQANRASGKDSSRRVLYPCARDAADTIETVLGKTGMKVERFNIYGAVAESGPVALNETPDVVTFASPSAARFFEEVIESGAVASLKRDTLVACIGPTTADAVAAAGYAHSITASVHTIYGLIDVIVGHYSPTD
jgi:uroporphyrinogen-III synthase